MYIFSKINLMLSPYFFNNSLEAGCDEAGRGCLAGPVTAAAVILPSHFTNNIINDSKKISEKTRHLLKPIIETQTLTFAVTHIEPEIIDEINILNASLKAMQECILKLNPTPIYIIVDGNRPLLSPNSFKNQLGKVFSAHEKQLLHQIPNKSIIKGDSKYLSIAAASILAKTCRDEYMNQIHEEYPMYNWAKNKGYPTLEHRAAIAKYGITKYHRKSFQLLPAQLEFKF
jgi:ribonuclease HII